VVSEIKGRRQADLLSPTKRHAIRSLMSNIDSR